MTRAPREASWRWPWCWRWRRVTARPDRSRIRAAARCWWWSARTRCSIRCRVPGSAPTGTRPGARRATSCAVRITQLDLTRGLLSLRVPPVPGETLWVRVCGLIDPPALERALRGLSARTHRRERHDSRRLDRRSGGDGASGRAALDHRGAARDLDRDPGEQDHRRRLRIEPGRVPAPVAGPRGERHAGARRGADRRALGSQHAAHHHRQHQGPPVAGPAAHRAQGAAGRRGPRGHVSVGSISGEFGRIDRRLQGVRAGGRAPASPAWRRRRAPRASSSASSSTAWKASRVPTRSPDRTAWRAVPVVAGSEIVTLDGVRMTRGEGADYSMDYDRAELTFTNRRPIGASSRITVECQIAVNRFRRNLAAVGARWGQGPWRSRRPPSAKATTVAARSPRRSIRRTVWRCRPPGTPPRMRSARASRRAAAITTWWWSAVRATTPSPVRTRARIAVAFTARAAGTGRLRRLGAGGGAHRLSLGRPRPGTLQGGKAAAASRFTPALERHQRYSPRHPGRRRGRRDLAPRPQHLLDARRWRRCRPRGASGAQARRPFAGLARRHHGNGRDDAHGRAALRSRSRSCRRRSSRKTGAWRRGPASTARSATKRRRSCVPDSAASCAARSAICRRRAASPRCGARCSGTTTGAG